MSILGAPSEWVNLIDPIVPQILRLVTSTWEEIAPPAPDAREDDITLALCRALRDNRTARGLMFTIDTQLVELDPSPGEDLGRLDLAFRPLIPHEDIYFCLECKRLNVVVNGQMRAYAAEYVTFGMLRFVAGQYARAVRHGGMLAYVLDGDVVRAIANVENNLRTQHVALGMAQPGTFLVSSVLASDSRVRETRHQRSHDTVTFVIHHIFMARRIATVSASDSQSVPGGATAQQLKQQGA